MHSLLPGVICCGGVTVMAEIEQRRSQSIIGEQLNDLILGKFSEI